jgi:asparagine synthase (glutamine-hydrolysing)
MARAVEHRGPDAEGTWVDAAAGIALGSRRLSIIDLSDAGAQPMTSTSGRYVLAYNGEIYNAPQLAPTLESAGRRFRGHSDTEVLVEAIDEWGVERALERANGMFAFACWDTQRRRLHLARDRMGEKPLYYGWMGQQLLFGSELKALRAHSSFDSEIDRDALALFLRVNCVPAPWSIFRDVKKLPPATVLTIDPEAQPDAAAPEPYWSLPDAGSGRRLSDEDAVDRLDELLRDATRCRMRSDVPLGAFLSGGIDSSTVVAMMQSQSAEPVRTFTIGNSVATFDEAERASAVANHLGTHHTELRVTPDDALRVIPRLPDVYDEPFADSSQIPTLLVSEIARRSVTVSLSGDGGDELFGGYDRYRWVPRVARTLESVPAGIRRAGAGAVLAVPPRVWDTAARAVPVALRPRLPGAKLTKLATIMRLDAPDAMFRRVISHWEQPDAIVIGANEPAIPQMAPWPPGTDAAARMMAIDAVTYLPDDILVKLDRATMSVSLEGRVPLLDHRLVELAATLPPDAKIRNGTSKWVLRRVLRRYVPDELFERPKTGFGVPIGDWLRGPLRDWAESLLAEDRLRAEGYLRPEPIRACWHEHLARRRDWEYHLWDVLMFEAWLESATR